MINTNVLKLIFGWVFIVLFSFVFVSFIPTLTTNGSYELRFIFACTLFISGLIWFCFVKIQSELRRANQKDE